MNSTKKILLTYGVGGHSAQMNRLVPKIKPLLADSKLISISDNTINPTWSSCHYVTGEVRNKNNHMEIFSNFGPLTVLKSLFKVNHEHKVDVVISTGPGLCFLVSLFFKLRGAKIVHIETWSRFTTKSFTGSLMYYISDRFYIQNKELIKIYPKAIYAGLL
ncbi:polysaccharide biosynthesis protein [Shewanella livingstonensis]|uniref:Polysaccharide biosynthesis protein n=1 Tax=Shewanella livingstonensis TaxID=150120 RepID=A0A3G8LXP5_9GAMM|nr:PssD/Cps14F family polysaccharide biosynthesis glycosyltransferase [Shewanella livingstonensis]AZG74177.1 polysaccharide biosynthesis protein [Shewanella livingstonensis]